MTISFGSPIPQSGGDATQRADALFDTAIGLHRAGRAPDAERAYRRVLGLNPLHAESFDGLGQIAARAGRFTAAVEMFGKAIAIKPGVGGFHLNLGNALKELGRIDDAITAYEKAIALKPDLAEAYGNLGSLYISQGRGDDACRAYEQAIERRPERGAYYRLRAFIKPIHPSDPLFVRMEKLAETMATLSETDQMELHFALAAAHGDSGDYARSSPHFLAGNRMKRRRVRYDEAKALAWTARIEEIFSRDFLAERADFGLATQRPIFVVGMPRSGSTLIEQILASHPDVYGAGELQILPHLLRHVSAARHAIFPEFTAALTASDVNHLAEQYLTILGAEAGSASRIVDKHLENFNALGLISLMLPRAKIIHIQRDPIATCLSAFAKLFNGNHLPYTYDLGELGRFYRAYERLMIHWRDVLPKGMMLEIRYEDLVGDFDRHARAIIAHCGLDWDDRCERFHETERVVKTASALQVRQPLYDTAVAKWHEYEDLVEQLTAALGGERATSLVSISASEKAKGLAAAYPSPSSELS
ncbi:MAG TPA: sulfotransferase [Methylovirgula sp.]